MARYRRRILLLDRAFQLKFSFYMCSWILVLSLIFPGVIYAVFEWIANFARAHLQGDSAAVIADVKRQVFWQLVLMEGVFIGLIFLMSLFISHRIAGPIYKLRQYMSGAKDGNLVADLKFRKDDHFQALAREYNDMISGIRTRLSDNIETLSTAIARVENASGHVSGDTRRDLDSALTDLRKVRDKISL